MNPLRIAFFGPSLVSEFWNGSAAYFRGVVHALAKRGHRVTCFEPAPLQGCWKRDIAVPSWAEVVTYRGDSSWSAAKAVEQARDFDLIIKVSGVGASDDILEAAVVALKSPRTVIVFWDMDAPATLDRIGNSLTDPFRRLIPRYDLILTHGGGEAVVAAYQSFGARLCAPLYNGFDPEVSFPAPLDGRYCGDLGFVGHCLPDREDRVAQFFLRTAAKMPEHQFVLGGADWAVGNFPANVTYPGAIARADLNAFNSSPTAILSVNRESSVRYGFSPPTRLFEAAGAGACLISDRWEGLESFLEPGVEVLVARDPDEVVDHVRQLTRHRAAAIGQAARRRLLAGHTYAHRAAQLEGLIDTGTAAEAEPLAAAWA